MPKRGRQKPGDKREKHEGSPAQLTLAAFFPTNDTQTALSEETKSNSSTVQAEKQDVLEPLESTEQPQPQEYTVTRTKKGKLPITYENRSKGKKVTVISNISGNSEILLAELRKRLGVGGVSRGTFIELQGDQQKYVEQFLKKHPNVK